MKPRRNTLFSLGIRVEGKPHPVRRYAELDLEQNLTCDHCSLDYTIYGAFGYCPDCGRHNSLAILKANFALIDKMLELAKTTDQEIKSKLVENALEDAVSAFDGFGRELCSVSASRATVPGEAGSVSFQSLASCQQKIKDLFSVDISSPVSVGDWNDMVVLFQKRHLLAHRMGVMDETYVKRTGLPPSMIGRKVSIDSEEVRRLVEMLQQVAESFFAAVSMQ